MQKNRMDEAEERELIDSTERGEWTTIGNIEERDLARLKARAAEEGMPYQTLINSILHKYLDR